MPAEVIELFEPVRAHMLRTRHMYYTWNLSEDRRFIRAALGREPVETDRFAGVLRCDACGRLLLNGGFDDPQ